MLPPSMRIHSYAATPGERRHLVDNGANEKIPSGKFSRGSQSCSSRDSHRRELQIEVPLQVISAQPSSASQAKAQPLDMNAHARSDVASPLPPQMDMVASGRVVDNSSHHPPSKQASTSSLGPQPGTLRCASQAPFFDPVTTTYNNVAASSGTMEASLTNMQQEQQLREWGEGLCRQVSALASEKARLEQSSGAAAATKRQLEEENKRLKHRNSELERKDGSSRTFAKENDDLRKQLAAYAVEVDALRDENEKLVQSRREAQDAVHQLTEELDCMQSRIGSLEQAEKELEQVRHQLGRLEKETRDQNVTCVETEKALTSLPLLRAQLEEEKEKSKLVVTCMRTSQALLAKLQEAFVKQTGEFKQFVASSKERQRETHGQLQASTHALEKQEGMLKSLRQQLAEAWRQHDESNRRWQERIRRETSDARAGDSERANGLIELERTRARLVGKELEHAEEKEGLEARLVDEARLRQKLEDELYRNGQAQRERNNKRQRRLGMNRALLRLERALEKNIARDMYEVHQGIVLEKVHDRNCRREPRLVVLLADEMQMKWSKDLQGLHGRFNSCLDLYEVIRIHYGSMSRACVLHTEVPPWRCFSLHTPRRSYDFCCPDEECVQRFVLCLSRLCDWASGAITTRSRFVALRGWCKLEDYCFKEQISLGRLFLEALNRVREAPGKMGEPQSPSPLPPLS